ncbi:hypothetical protein [Marinimicrobium sp. C2-29]|uniref:hypothetical protein n=1 Tax=Marinimicrobium sp. C2-29 TaxID=3139825 RepID=UPI00313A29FE
MPESENPFEALFLNQLRVGTVIYKFCDFTTPPKFKFLVVASVDPRLLVLCVNSEINTFYIRNGTDRFHVVVPVCDHDFLVYDSYACCVEAHAAFDISDLKQEILEDYNRIVKGFLTDECLEEIYNAVKSNDVIRRGYQKEIVASIEQQLPHLTSTLSE